MKRAMTAILVTALLGASAAYADHDRGYGRYGDKHAWKEWKHEQKRWEKEQRRAARHGYYYQQPPVVYYRPAPAVVYEPQPVYQPYYGAPELSFSFRVPLN